MNRTLHILSIILLLTGATANTYAQTINGNVYGGGEMAKVQGNTNVTINAGKLGADVFGGGEGKLYDTAGGGHAIGDVSMSADISGTTTVTINGGEFAVKYDEESTADVKPFLQHYNIYGGGNIASIVGESHVYAKRGMIAKGSDNSGTSGITGTGTFLKNSNPQGIAQAYYHEGQMYFCIFGGGYGKNTSVTGNTWVDFNISGMTDINSTVIEDDLLEYQSYLDVIGGGFNGTVQGNTNVHVGGNAMCRNVYGGGLYATIGTKDDTETGKTNVYITGGNVDNVYGGGVMGDIMTSTNVNIGLKSNLDFDFQADGTTPRTYTPDNNKVTILMSVYGANDVSGHVPQSNITHNGGKVEQNMYGAGNGNYRGYYTPNLCDYADGENDNYFIVDYSGDTSKDGKSTKGPKGDTYKGRPQTDNVSITLGGNSNEDKAVVLGQVFGGGNSCTVGKWHTDWVESGGKYAGKPHDARDDKDYFIGEGSINITLNDHVRIGYDNTTLAAASDEIKKMYTRDNENVSGLYMGCSGDVLATQSTAEDDNDYHHYYDSYTAKYWPGFAVFDNNGHPLSREEGLNSFKAYLNNILVWSNDVHLTITGSDIWLANFVGGGFRGSMKRKDNSNYSWTLPAGVTVGNCVVGGAYNTDVVYRVFDTESDMHTYTETDGHYNYCTTVKQEWQEGTDYHHIIYGADGTTIKGIARFMFSGGLLDNDGNPTDVVLTLNNNMDGGEAAGVFGGCYSSGTVKNTEINYRATGAHSVYGGGALANISGSSVVNLLDGSLTDAYGGGLGRLADVENEITSVSALVYGNATVTLNGSVVNGSIYGANNINGTPLGHVKVHVLQTQKRAKTDTDPVEYEKFDVPAVYGGGNQAAYVPTGSYNTDGCLTDKSKYAEVLIENCDNSIAYVYGGGNAAPVPATEVTIYGANAIDNAFAGGNGAGDGNKGADIGYLGFFSETGEETPKYGSGETHITIYGGTVNNVYGGSNTLGYIRTHASVDVPEFPDDYEGAKCELHLGNVHAGGNQAEMFCGGSVTLACSEGAQALYAGANSADIHGDIDLVINSGTYGKVFGGNNANGNIYGHIKIDIDETGCFPIMIGELYGCGNDAAYSVYGYNDNGTCKTEGEKLYDDPTVNIYSCTLIGKIFGGGKGSDAIVYGNPTVYVNTIKGRWAGCSVENSDPKKQMPAPAFRLDADGNRVE
ncbi:MAG: hypothetical protein KBT39_11105, partial [Bacteroidales bacterium]|nr:hypothetical protein [Bacteroidales bacterium]